MTEGLIPSPGHQLLTWAAWVEGDLPHFLYLYKVHWYPLIFLVFLAIHIAIRNRGWGDVEIIAILILQQLLDLVHREGVDADILDLIHH
jgi:hypothetical protein